MQIHKRHCAGNVTPTSSRTIVQQPTESMSAGLSYIIAIKRWLRDDWTAVARSATLQSLCKGPSASGKCLNSG